MFFFSPVYTSAEPPSRYWKLDEDGAHLRPIHQSRYQPRSESMKSPESLWDKPNPAALAFHPKGGSQTPPGRCPATFHLQALRSLLLQNTPSLRTGTCERPASGTLEGGRHLPCQHTGSICEGIHHSTACNGDKQKAEWGGYGKDALILWFQTGVCSVLLKKSPSIFLREGKEACRRLTVINFWVTFHIFIWLNFEIIVNFHVVVRNNAQRFHTLFTTFRNGHILQKSDHARILTLIQTIDLTQILPFLDVLMCVWVCVYFYAVLSCV